HLTLAFLGSVSLPDVEKTLSSCPRPPFQIGPCGWFDTSLLIPKQEPRLVAWHAHWLDDGVRLYQKELADWLREKGFGVDERGWLSHITMCRQPFDSEEWTHFFKPLPFYVGPLHLYESLGHSTYRPLWTSSLASPFVEIEHMADIAFMIYGKNIHDLYEHALIALAFKDPSLLIHWRRPAQIAGVEELVMLLNEAVRLTDQDAGCEFKAVSFHGDIQSVQEGLLQWEMIVDV
ncbi:MAG: hypothetical protein KGQ49_04890, partial [Verrucomicrobia bacterium]|nr:hypothetical protein [Verrucomicrobiota bacterium]